MVKNIANVLFIVLTIALADFFTGLFSFTFSAKRIGFWFLLMIALGAILTFVIFIEVVVHKKDIKDYKNLIPKSKSKKGNKHGKHKKGSGKTKGSKPEIE